MAMRLYRPNTESVRPDGAAPRKTIGGVLGLVAPNATTADRMKPTTHGALDGTITTGRHATRRLNTMINPPKTKTAAKIAMRSPSVNQ